MSNGSVPPPAGAAPKKKGLPPLAWVAIGCGALIILAAIAFAAVTGLVAYKAKQFVDEAESNPALAAARIYALANPEVEVVEADEESQQVTLRNKKTGEEITVDLEDIEEGRIRFESSEGSLTIDAREEGEGGSLTVTTDEGETVYRGGGASTADVPDWVLTYPGATVAGTFTSKGAEGSQGAFSMTTDDPPQEVLDYYERELGAAGFEIRTQTFSGQEGMPVGIISATLEEPSRTMTVSAARDGGQTVVSVQYGAEG